MSQYLKGQELRKLAWESDKFNPNLCPTTPFAVF